MTQTHTLVVVYLPTVLWSLLNLSQKRTNISSCPSLKINEESSWSTIWDIMSSHVTIEDMMIDTPYIINDNLTGKMLLRICFTRSLLSRKARGGPPYHWSEWTIQTPQPLYVTGSHVYGPTQMDETVGSRINFLLNIKPLKLRGMDPGIRGIRLTYANLSIPLVPWSMGPQ